jgi:hypothetical protein
MNQNRRAIARLPICRAIVLQHNSIPVGKYDFVLPRIRWLLADRRIRRHDRLPMWPAQKRVRSEFGDGEV